MSNAFDIERLALTKYHRFDNWKDALESDYETIMIKCESAKLASQHFKSLKHALSLQKGITAKCTDLAITFNSINKRVRFMYDYKRMLAFNRATCCLVVL